MGHRLLWSAQSGLPLLLLLCGHVSRSNIANGQTYEFQGSGNLNTETYLLAHLPKRIQASSPQRSTTPHPASSIHAEPPATSSESIEILDEYSLCVAFSVFSHLPFTTIYGYFAETDVFRLSIMDHFICMANISNECHNLGVTVFPDTWYHVCMVASDDTFLFYHNGILLPSRMTKIRMPLGGSLVVGQEQDSPVGNFSLGQAFRGQVAHLGMWARALTRQEVYSVAQCEVPMPPGDLLPWGSSVWTVHGSVRESEVSPCHRPLKQPFPFWEHSTYEEAQEKLETLGMVMAVPVTLAEKNYMELMLHSAPRECTDQFSSVDVKYASINVMYDDENGDLINLNSNVSLEYNQNVSAQDSIGSPLVFIASDGEWSVKKTNTSCYIGEHLGQRPIFHLRGLCDVNSYAKDYSEFVISLSNNQTLYFAGLYGAVITKTGTRWDVKHRYKNKTMASIQSISLPVGRRKWNVTSEDDFCTFSNAYKALTLSICKEGEFTCTDGFCVPLSQRCDLVPNCSDWSDEHYCKTVLLPKGYLDHLPPPPPINFTLNISFSHVELDLKSMTFTMKMSIYIKWFDGRVRYLNLRDGEYTNKLSMEGGSVWPVWVPHLKLTDMVNQGPFNNPAVFVEKQTTGHFLDDDVEYAGATNALMFTNEVMPKFKCPLNLELYPWDSQICSVSITIINVSPENTFIDGTGNYLGTEDLQEYKFGNWWLNASHNSVQLSFKLMRRYEKHVWTTIVPTSLLLMISYGTLFIPPKSFAERGTISLTSLLVLVELYTETLSSLPVTSYNKKVEKWYILLIIYVSLIIAVHLATSNPMTSISEDNIRKVKSQEYYPVVKTSKLHRVREKLTWGFRCDSNTILVTARIVFAIAIIFNLVLFYLNLF